MPPTSARPSSGIRSKAASPRPCPSSAAASPSTPPSGYWSARRGTSPISPRQGRPAARAGSARPGAGLQRRRRYLAVGTGSGQTALWDGNVRRHLGTLTSTTSAANVTALTFSPDARVLAVGMANGAILLWDTETRQPMGHPFSLPAISCWPSAWTATSSTSPAITSPTSASTSCRRTGPPTSRATPSSPPAAVTRGEADRQQGVFAQWEGRPGRTADASQGRG
ncbi:hypothetical protein AB0J71_46280 [Nonomuraea sp. NPDC049637]|uniref:WD40 domain-containing protein n=1 Tax=Nonomuraea sp. NPDC049637 TaxID=3154356 RepID=UPI003418ABE1